MLEVKNIYCGYNGEDVVKNVSFKVNRGENICIVGPNGCGKSTLLKAIANLLSFKGEIPLDGKDTKLLKRKELATKVSLMTQSSNILFPYSIYETVALGRYAHLNGVFSRLSKNDDEIIRRPYDFSRKNNRRAKKEWLVSGGMGGEIGSIQTGN